MSTIYRTKIFERKFDGAAQSFFVTYSLGLNTNRDAFAYNFSRTALESNIRMTIDHYNTHEPMEVDSTKFVWSDLSKSNKNRGREYVFNAAQIVENIYRPFCKQNLYFDEHLNDRRGQMPIFFPNNEENLLILVTLANRVVLFSSRFLLPSRNICKLGKQRSRDSLHRRISSATSDR